MMDQWAMWGIGIAGGALAWAGGVVVWAVRQEGRLNLHERMHMEHARRHDEMRSDVSYIRERIDRALNGVGK